MTDDSSKDLLDSYTELEPNDYLYTRQECMSHISILELIKYKWFTLLYRLINTLQ